MAAAKYVFGIFVMMSCFTTGFGLNCYRCRTNVTLNDSCATGVGMHNMSIKCDFNDIWPARDAKVFEFKTTNLPSEGETKKESNLACIKTTFTSPELKQEGITMLERDCVFKKYGDVDGCGFNKKKAENSEVIVGLTTKLIVQLFAIYKDSTVEKCVLCSTDNCNATTRLTATFFMYPPLFLLVVIICKQFF